MIEKWIKEGWYLYFFLTSDFDVVDICEHIRLVNCQLIDDDCGEYEPRELKIFCKKCGVMYKVLVING